MEIPSVFAAQRYEALKPATNPSLMGSDQSDAFEQIAANFARTLETSEALARDAMLGKADPHALIEALAQTELAVETATVVRNKVVEAYQEIMRMPV